MQYAEIVGQAEWKDFVVETDARPCRRHISSVIAINLPAAEKAAPQSVPKESCVLLPVCRHLQLGLAAK